MPYHSYSFTRYSRLICHITVISSPDTVDWSAISYLFLHQLWHYTASLMIFYSLWYWYAVEYCSTDFQWHNNRIASSFPSYFDLFTHSQLNNICFMLQWKLPAFGSKDSTSVPSGCLGVSYMDGKIWLDVRDLNGKESVILTHIISFSDCNNFYTSLSF